MESTENWRPVPGYEGYYEVSDLGRVRSLDGLDNRGRRRNGKLLSPSLRSGYRRIQLHRDGMGRTEYVHTLVLCAFVGPRPSGHEACHGEGGPLDNRLANLRWGTSTDNNFDQVKAGTHPNSRRSECKRGHAFSGPNLESWRPGTRACRACHQESAAATYHRRPFDASAADERYRTIMKEHA